MERTLDYKGRWRNHTVAFRVSDEESKLLNDLVALSGLTKQDYITRRLLCRDVVVQGKNKTDAERFFMKNVQIPYELFVSLVRYHLLEDDTCLNEIRRGLEQKMDSLMHHELYVKYKTALTQEEREKARQEYLEKRGVPDNFRW